MTNTNEDAELPKYSPLLIRSFYDKDPKEFQRFKEQMNSYRLSVGCFKRDLFSGIIYQSKLYTNDNEYEFVYPDTFFSPLFIEPELSDVLIGRKLSILANIPGAERCTISRIEGKRVTFRHDDEPYFVEKSLPILTRQNYQKKEILEKLKDRKNIKLSQMSINLIKALKSSLGSVKAIETYFSPALIKGKKLKDPNLIDLVVNDHNGTIGVIRLSNNIEIRGDKIVIEGTLPATVVAALPEQSAKNVIDHWLFEDVKVLKAKQLKKRVDIKLENNPKYKLMDFFGDDVETAIIALEKSFEKSKSEIYREYENRIKGSTA